MRLLTDMVTQFFVCVYVYTGHSAITVREACRMRLPALELLLMRSLVPFVVPMIMALGMQNTHAAEILARVRTPPWIFTLERSGDGFDDKCTLELIGSQYQRTCRTSLKHEFYKCSVFGSIQIIASSSADFIESLVIVEAGRGGDGDHTGPILQVFKLRNGIYQRIGEQELFNAVYERKNGKIETIFGEILFNFCQVCDGPGASEVEDRIFVPVRLRIEENSIRLTPLISKLQGENIKKQFLARKGEVLTRKQETSKYKDYIEKLEKELWDLLSR